MYVAHWDILKQRSLPANGDMSRNEEGSDDIAHPDSEILVDDGHHVLSGVQDVLRQHQYKTGIPKAPNPDALVKHAKKLNGQDGPVSSADEEINVQSSLLSIIIYANGVLVQDGISEPESAANSRQHRSMMDGETRKRGINIYLSLVKQLIEGFCKEHNSWGEGECLY